MDRIRGVGAVIVAAGSSERMGGRDKMSVLLRGKPLLAWSVDVCQGCTLVQQIVIVLRERNMKLGERLVEERAWTKASVCLGGLRRQDSVKEGVRQLRDCGWAVIHDGARPFLTRELSWNGVQADRETGAAAAAVPVKDTIKLADDTGLVTATLERGRLWAIQTPQVFAFDVITQAYQELATEVSDDAAAVERREGKVKLYMGSYRNIKVTTPEDLMLAEVIVQYG